MRTGHIPKATATALAVAFVVYSCGGNLSEAEKLNLDKIPLQSVDSMFFIQSQNGRLKMRVEAPRMEVYEHDTVSYDLFPSGLNVYAYGENGILETTIVSEKARHDKTGSEQWSAFGNVVVKNIVKNETMETDTLYWDADKHEIWTDCYVKMYSPSGLMQGYGMRSDEMARNSILMNPFDTEFLIEDENNPPILVDSVNFIGPIPKK
ncbi:MAG: LPS export ABC transporter periplasmic protein LptC [Bacteroidales bacterium]|nr:LPS export ABC transporter periplasmic protein LptC [Bacteroidales bacterium]